MTEKSFGALFDAAAASDRYQVERVVLRLLESLHGRMVAKGVTRAELARRIGKSPAYVTKVFRGDANFTIETIVGLARAVDGEVNVLISDPRLPDEVPTLQATSEPAVRSAVPLGGEGVGSEAVRRTEAARRARPTPKRRRSS